MINYSCCWFGYLFFNLSLGKENVIEVIFPLHSYYHQIKKLQIKLQKSTKIGQIKEHAPGRIQTRARITPANSPVFY